MKYSEFEREVEREGFNVDRKSGTAYVDSTTGTVMSISADDLFMFDCDWSAFVHLNRDVQEKLFDLAYQLAKTPIVEREEEKKYHLKLELPIPLEDSSMHWLNQKVGASKYHFGSQENIRDYKTIFTESEVAQMDLTGLKLIEVKDE